MNLRLTIAVMTAVAIGFALVPLPASAAPLFGPPAIYPNGPAGVGESHATVAAADLNGDGAPDLAVADFIGGQVRVLTNDGDGTFSLVAMLKAASPPSAIAAVDLDSDGRPDLAVGDMLTGGVTIWHNEGNASFVKGGTYFAGLSPTRILTGDYNHDSHTDLAVASYLGVGNLVIFLGQGNAGLVRGQTLSVGTLVLTMAQGDLNGDSHADLVVGEFIGRLSVLLGRGDGAFTPAGTLQVLGLEDVDVTDANGDGRADLVVPVVSANKISTFLGRGDGSFAAPIDSTVNPKPALLWPQTFVVTVVAGDVNADGRIDLAVSGGTDRTVYVLAGDGAGRFATGESLATPGVARALVLGDLNLDDRPDLVSAEFAPSISVFLHA